MKQTHVACMCAQRRAACTHTCWVTPVPHPAPHGPRLTWVCMHTPAEEGDLYPYLLVNIGSGVSMVKVTGEGQYERVSGSSLGGGTFWGLCRLLTQRKDFDEMLELSMQGDNANVGGGGVRGGKAPLVWRVLGVGLRRGLRRETALWWAQVVCLCLPSHRNAALTTRRWTCWWATSTAAATTPTSACRRPPSRPASARSSARWVPQEAPNVPQVTRVCLSVRVSEEGPSEAGRTRGRGLGEHATLPLPT